MSHVSLMNEIFIDDCVGFICVLNQIFGEFFIRVDKECLWKMQLDVYH